MVNILETALVIVLVASVVRGSPFFFPDPLEKPYITKEVVPIVTKTVVPVVTKKIVPVVSKALVPVVHYPKPFSPWGHHGHEHKALDHHGLGGHGFGGHEFALHGHKGGFGHYF